MNQLKYFFIIISIIFGACSASNETKKLFPWDSSLSVEQNIAKNAIAVENTDDFSFLDRIIRNRSVIILGEQGHFDFSTLEVKINMIRYLQGKGFHSVALEGAPFLTTYAFSNPGFAELTQNWDIRYIWALTDVEHKIFKSFFEAIQDREIKVWGIDILGHRYDIDVVKAILAEYSDYEAFQMNWNRLRHLYIRKFVPIPLFGRHLFEDEPFSEISTNEKYELMRMIGVISNYTQYIMFSKGATTDLKAIMQWIRNLNPAFSFAEYWKNNFYIDVQQIVKCQKQHLHNRNRSMQMGENIDWIIRNFPEEKFTVWTANYHGARDISQTVFLDDSLFYFRMQTMGEFLAARHGSRVYSLAFTSLENREVRGKLEEEIFNAADNAPFAFIDFEPLRFADGYRNEKFESNILGRKRAGKWLNIFDGLYYVRDLDRLGWERDFSD